LPARPKSPLDPKKDGESLSYSMLPLSDGPEGSHNRPQVGSVRHLNSMKLNGVLISVLKLKTCLLTNNENMNFQVKRKPKSAFRLVATTLLLLFMPSFLVACSYKM
jgi:hypothetical protein